MVDLGTLSGRTFDGVVFDLDETLIMSGSATIRCWTKWAIEYGVTREQLEGCVGMPSAKVVSMVVAPEVANEAAQTIEGYELSDLDDVVPYAGAMEAFTELPLNRVAIATSCTRQLLEARLAASGLPEPEVLVHVGLVKNGKPAPDSVLLAAELLRTDPERLLVVEDAPAGIAGAKAAGAASLAVTNTTPSEKLPADAVIESLADIAWVVTDDGISVVARG